MCTSKLKQKSKSFFEKDMNVTYANVFLKSRNE